ncbi:MAG: LLM class flavin-dependent oxidoreductase [Planctomycetes bacterium]|nr:LLM class flavin-dependent oxidoreductase [Planctomycetota bacterium]
MDYDVFFSISQTPVDGRMPTEAEMFRNFFREVEAADRLGYGVAWVAESHLSTEVQRRHPDPVVPHWRGEVGLNTDIFQLAHQVFRRTRRIEVGSAVMSLLVNGGPIAAAERVAAFAALHGVDPGEGRRLHVGFAAGRFEFMYRAHGVVPRGPVEEAAWPALKGKVFAEATEVFLRLLRGEALSSEQLRPPVLRRADFRDEAQWARVLEAAGRPGAERVELARRWGFDELQVVPRDWRRELVQLVIGSHEPTLQEEANRLLPVRVFNLSITRSEVIEDTHRRMARAYHPDGGPWRRGYMPRTVMVFLDEDPGRARERARTALSAYWTALEGTLDPRRVEQAADNALVGDAGEVARQAVDRFHPEDRLMLWFDFFDHDCDRVIAGMEGFMRQVRPRVEELR